ncbi:MAG: DinB family protein [Acidobacteriaceae bacterium]
MTAEETKPEETKPEETKPEPWLRGTLTDVPAVARGVLHALETAREDVARWCGGLTGVEVNARPAGLPSVAFQVRHIAGSMDRMLTYAEGRLLSEQQKAALGGEDEHGAMAHVLLRDFEKAVDAAMTRVRALAGEDLETPRFVGRKRLPTTVGGLLVHVADHTQRHVGQVVTTVKVVVADRGVLQADQGYEAGRSWL